MKSFPLIQSISDTGTSRGWSYQEAPLFCGERAYRNSLGERKKGLTGIEAIDVGTVGHALLMLYYRAVLTPGQDPDLIDTSLIEWTDLGRLPDSYRMKVYQQADFEFQKYRLKHSATELGTVRAVEELYEVEHNGTLYTIRPDLIVQMTKKKAQSLGLPGAGWYQVDHKFRGREKPTDEVYTQRDLRFAYYNWVYQHIFPRRSYHGVIVNNIYRGKDSNFVRHLVEPSEEAYTRLESVLERSSVSRAQRTRRPEMCTYRGEVCPYIKSCSGINAKDSE